MGNCPVHCGEGMMQCPGGSDWNGCPMPDTCIPADATSDCPVTCPLVCGHNEMKCPGTVDEKGCMSGEYCLFNEPTAICQHACKAQCPEGEWECPPEQDGNGCWMGGMCSAGGQCPNAKNPGSDTEPEEECVDKWSAKNCNRKKGKCHKNKIQKKCAKTC